MDIDDYIDGIVVEKLKYSYEVVTETELLNAIKVVLQYYMTLHDYEQWEKCNVRTS